MLLSTYYTGQQTKNLCKQRKFWQRKFFAKKRMQRKQRKILVINPLFCTIFQEKMSILWKNFGIWIFLIKLQHKTTIKLGENLQNRSFYLMFFSVDHWKLKCMIRSFNLCSKTVRIFIFSSFAISSLLCKDFEIFFASLQRMKSAKIWPL